MADFVLTIRGVSKDFSGSPVLRDFDLEVAHGEFITLLGPSGCGKTTLLRLVAGFEQPDTGEILLGDVNLLDQPPEHRKINTIFQSYALFPHMNVFENVAFGLKLQGVKKKELNARVEQALADVKMNGLARRYPRQLSGGQQQRVAVARAVVNQPSVLLLDEPLSALDARLRRDLQLELKRIQRELGIAFILVTHDQEEALSMSDRVVVIEDGTIAQVGTPRQVYETPKSLYVAKFVGDINLFPGLISEQREDNVFLVSVQGQSLEVKAKRQLRAGQAVQLVLRPEDLRLGDAIEEGMPVFKGAVVERSYRGATLDTIIRLENGQTVQACEFFDEDDPDFDYNVGEKVEVSWVKGWEVMLPDEELV